MCLALGGDNIHPDILLERLTARQWQDWVEYDSVFPIGAKRIEYAVAFAAWQLACLQVENPDGLKPEQFMIDWLYDAEAEIQKHMNPTEEQIEEIRKKEEAIKSIVMSNAAAGKRQSSMVTAPPRRRRASEED